MKKFATIIMVCFIALSLPLGAFADGEYTNANALYGSWNTEKQVGEQTVFEMVYPDGVCGVWSTDGSADNLTFAVTDDERGEKAKADILAAVEDDSTVTFATQKYTHSELKAVQDAVSEHILGYSGEEIGVAGWGIYEMENRVHVDIIVSKPGAEDFMRWGYENFGDMIMFESVDGYAVPAAEELLDSEASGSSGMGSVIAAALAVVVIICCVLFAKKRMFGKGKVKNAE